MDKGRLFIVATPIGNLEDITKRAVRVLTEADFIAAEDTRRTIKLLNNLNIKSTMISFHEHSKKEKSDMIIGLLLEGKNIALVSDAGTPLISDPGEELTALAIKNCIEVIPVPGPCSPVAALTVSGISSKKFVFEGFLPKSGAERKNALRGLKEEEKTSVIFESPNRLLKTLMEFKAEFGSERKAAVCRELTKIYEEVMRGTIDEIISGIENKEIKGEIVIVLEGAKKKDKTAGDFEIYLKLKEYINKGNTKKDAVLKTADFLNINKNTVYKILNRY